jgi:hypothetical protein
MAGEYIAARQPNIFAREVIDGARTNSRPPII